MAEMPVFIELPSCASCGPLWFLYGIAVNSQSLNAAQAGVLVPLVQVTFPGLCSQANYLRNKQL